MENLYDYDEYLINLNSKPILTIDNYEKLTYIKLDEKNTRFPNYFINDNDEYFNVIKDSLNELKIENYILYDNLLILNNIDFTKSMLFARYIKMKFFWFFDNENEPILVHSNINYFISYLFLQEINKILETKIFINYDDYKPYYLNDILKYYITYNNDSDFMYLIIKPENLSGYIEIVNLLSFDDIQFEFNNIYELKKIIIKLFQYKYVEDFIINNKGIIDIFTNLDLR